MTFKLNKKLSTDASSLSTLAAATVTTTAPTTTTTTTTTMATTTTTTTATTTVTNNGRPLPFLEKRSKRFRKVPKSNRTFLKNRNFVKIKKVEFSYISALESSIKPLLGELRVLTPPHCCEVMLKAIHVEGQASGLHSNLVLPL